MKGGRKGKREGKEKIRVINARNCKEGRKERIKTRKRVETFFFAKFYDSKFKLNVLKNIFCDKKFRLSSLIIRVGI